MTRTRVRWRRAACLAAAVAGLAVGARAWGLGAENPADRRVVRPGDTLWGIARSRVGPEGDPRPVVEAIRRANGLGIAPLVPGVRLTVP